jgi:acetolactate synthase small subunit
VENKMKILKKIYKGTFKGRKYEIGMFVLLNRKVREKARVTSVSARKSDN